jgi:hypothetical protein
MNSIAIAVRTLLKAPVSTMTLLLVTARALIRR